MEHPEPNDWLSELGKSLKAEIIQEQPKGWATYRQIAKVIGLTDTGAKDYANRKVRNGEWQTQRVRMRDSMGRAVMTNLYRPVFTNATAAAKSR